MRAEFEKVAISQLLDSFNRDAAIYQRGRMYVKRRRDETLRIERSRVARVSFQLLCSFATRYFLY